MTNGYKYFLPLPTLPMLRELFTVETVDKFERQYPNLRSRENNLAFGEDIAGRLRRFIQFRSETPDVMVGLGGALAIAFNCSPDTLAALENSMDDLLKDFEFSEDKRAKGCRWNGSIVVSNIGKDTRKPG